MPGLLGLVSDAPYRSLGTVSKLQPFVARVVNEVRPTGRNESAGRHRLLRPALDWPFIGRGRTLRDRVAFLLPFQADYGKQNHNCRSGESEP